MNSLFNCFNMAACFHERWCSSLFLSCSHPLLVFHHPSCYYLLLSVFSLVQFSAAVSFAHTVICVQLSTAASFLHAVILLLYLVIWQSSNAVCFLHLHAAIRCCVFSLCSHLLMYLSLVQSLTAVFYPRVVTYSFTFPLCGRLLLYFTLV